MFSLNRITGTSIGGGGTLGALSRFSAICARISTARTIAKSGGGFPPEPASLTRACRGSKYVTRRAADRDRDRNEVRERDREARGARDGGETRIDVAGEERANARHRDDRDDEQHQNEERPAQM